MTNNRIMTCETLDERLADYLEDELDLPARAAAERHLAACLRCAALVRDLKSIQHDARELGELRPSRDLWDGIASRIEAPVIPLAPAAPVRATTWRRLRVGAVAAALVAVTAGVTYTITAAWLRSGAGTSSLAGDTRPSPNVLDSGTSPGSDSPEVAVSPPRAVGVGADGVVGVEAENAGADAALRTRAVARTPAQVTYDREIQQLRRIVTERRPELDPATIAILESSLRVIDTAIAQSRAALARDPASRFLNSQLNSALDKKLELLKTAALLPSVRS